MSARGQNGRLNRKADCGIRVTNLIQASKRRGLKFNMLLCWCIGKATASVKEFYLLPVGDKLMQYDSLAVNTIIKNRLGEISSCDILFPMILRPSTANIRHIPHKRRRVVRTGICPPTVW